VRRGWSIALLGGWAGLGYKEEKDKYYVKSMKRRVWHEEMTATTTAAVITATSTEKIATYTRLNITDHCGVGQTVHSVGHTSTTHIHLTKCVVDRRILRTRQTWPYHPVAYGCGVQ
jgi:hypothetical protein